MKTFMFFALSTLLITNSTQASEWQTGISFSQVQLKLSGKINIGGTYMYTEGEDSSDFDVNENVNGLTASLSRGFGNSKSINFRASGFATTENDLNRSDISISYSQPLGGLTAGAGYYFNDTEIGGNFVTNAGRIQIESAGLFASVQKTVEYSANFKGSLKGSILFGDYDMFFGTGGEDTYSSDTVGFSVGYSLIHLTQSGGVFNYGLEVRQLDYNGSSENYGEEDNFVLSIGTFF